MAAITKKSSFRAVYRALLQSVAQLFSESECSELRGIIADCERQMPPAPLGKTMKDNIYVAQVVLNDMSLGKPALLAVMLHEYIENHLITVAEIEQKFRTPISSIISGMARIDEIYAKSASLETENFRKLLLSFAEDIRVILIILAQRYHLMYILDKFPEDEQHEIARESSFLYAPLAHRMGLYAIKTELEDLSLKFTNISIYKEISEKLNETKASRDKYIADFIKPLQINLEEVGFPFSIRGRTKSIHSIYNKIKKQNTAFEGIYDLFAIRVIFDTPPDKEKLACWQAYSIVADMYQPNPKRMRDWLTIPKSNGYESLHTTVLGPENKWVEVQIRTKRMDEIAEKGLAAHWKYKGGQSEKGMDEWLRSVREMLENSDLNAIDFMDEFKMQLYDKEVFVFTPNGDLHKMVRGATVLDFAFSIHTNLGCKCTGAKVNGKNVPIKHVLSNGDQVEVLTSPTQKPNNQWLNIVATSRAKTKIRQALKEIEFKDAEIGRETLVRRFKNWKIDLEDGKLACTAKKFGYKTISDLYQAIARATVDIHKVRDVYQEIVRHDQNPEQSETKSADTFISPTTTETQNAEKEDVLVIGEDLKDVDFKLAKCCHPIYGDKVFGFVSSMGGIKIHRTDCPNAPQMIQRFGYRIVKARWSGKAEGAQYPVTLRIVGNDDVGIVANISSIINKGKNVSIRSISIDSNAGLFEGNLTVMVGDNKELDAVVKKIKTVKGVKNVERQDFI
ncbi:MAG: RelA/SpoT family protein [Prevotellaceae bacterium]|jgi:GTP pyrophosphokinase|nr:RelA/SpoT family protein [Prevotellaceae bacterium]